MDADLELEPALQRHVRRCARCRRFYEQEVSVARGLARRANKERATPSPFLMGRIMAAVERAGRPALAPPLWPRLVWGAVLAAALLLAVKVVIGPRAAHPAVATQDIAQVEEKLTALQNSLPDEEKLQRWSGSLEQPLDQEMRALVHDARFAAQTLVRNFLPDRLAQLPEDTTR